MTDWWPILKYPDEDDTINLKNLVEAQNDIYMLTHNALTMQDNQMESIKSGALTIGQLQRNATNILRYIMNTHTFERFEKFGASKASVLLGKFDELTVAAEICNPVNDEEYSLSLEKSGNSLIKVDYESECSNREQFIVGMAINGINAANATINGSQGKSAVFYRDTAIGIKEITLKIIYPVDKIKINKLSILQEI